MLKQVKLSGWRSFAPDQPIQLNELNSVNLLIGSNNIGKSNLGRFLVKLRDCLQDFSDIDPWSNSSAKDSWKDTLDIYFPLQEVDFWLRGDDEIKAEISISADNLYIPVSCPNFFIDNDAVKFSIRIRKLNEQGRLLITPVTKNGRELIIKENSSCKLLLENGNYTEQVTSSHIHRNISLAVCRYLASSIIEIKPLRDPKRESNHGENSTDGGDIIKLLHTKSEDKNRKRFWIDCRSDLEDWFKILLGEHDIRFSISEKDFGIEVRRDKTPLHCDLSDLGAGVSEILMLLAYLRLNREKQFCVIVDEPESHLHPGAVVELTKIINQNLPNHQLIITSHSTALIDGMNSNWRVFRARRGDKDGTIFESLNDTNRKLSLLSDLGIRPSQLFLTKVSLWVEGPSDVHYWQALLKEANPDLISGRDFSFVTYGGASSSHLNFDNDQDCDKYLMEVLKISHRAIIICDRDRNHDEEDRPLIIRLEEAARKLPKYARIELSTGREIENSIEPSVLQSILDEFRPKRFNIPKPVRKLVYEDYSIGGDDAFDKVIADAARFENGSLLKKEDKDKIKQRLNGAKNQIAHRIREYAENNPGVFNTVAIQQAKGMIAWMDETLI